MRRIVFVLVLGLLVALAVVEVAQAHIDLSSIEVRASADPTAGPELVLRFSGPLDQAFSKVRVLDTQGAEVDPGPGAVDPKDASVLLLSLGALPSSEYQAAWRVRSVDGHVLEGTDPFTLALEVALTTTTAPTTTPAAATTTTAATLPSTATSTTEPPTTATTAVSGGAGSGDGGSGGTTDGGSASTRSENSALREAPLRWLNYLAAALVLGTAAFVLVVWGPVAPPGGPVGAPPMLARLGALVLLATNLVLIVVQAAYAAGVGLGSAMGQPLVDVLGTRSGWDWMVRIVLILVLVGVTWSLPPRLDRLRWGAVLALGAAVMLSFSLVSHAATAWAPPLSIAVDWVHLLAMGVWLGGLPALGLALLGLRKESGPATTTSQPQPVGAAQSVDDAAAATTAGRAVTIDDGAPLGEAAIREPRAGLTVAGLVGRFSAVAVTCVALLVVTGIYNLVVHLDGLGSLLSSGWGWALAVKLLLFGVLLVFGAVNKLRLLPRAEEEGGRSSLLGGGDPAGVAAPFLRTVPSEVVVGAVLLLAVGIMTSLAPM